MAHGDDNGLRVPPRLAPTQVQVMVVKDGDGVLAAAAKLRDALRDAAVRVGFDDRVDVPFGRRAVDAELRGYPGTDRGRPPRSRRRQRRPGSSLRQLQDPDADRATLSRPSRPRSKRISRPCTRRRRRAPRRTPPTSRRSPTRSRRPASASRASRGRRSARPARRRRTRSRSPCAASSGPTEPCRTPRTRRVSSPIWPASY